MFCTLPGLLWRTPGKLRFPSFWFSQIQWVHHAFVFFVNGSSKLAGRWSPSWPRSRAWLFHLCMNHPLQNFWPTSHMATDPIPASLAMTKRGLGMLSWICSTLPGPCLLSGWDPCFLLVLKFFKTLARFSRWTGIANLRHPATASRPGSSFFLAESICLRTFPAETGLFFFQALLVVYPDVLPHQPTHLLTSFLNWSHQLSFQKSVPNLSNCTHIFFQIFEPLFFSEIFICI